MIKHFQEVATAYNLPLIEFDDSKTVLRCVSDNNGNVFIGQFECGESKTKKANGIIRKSNKDGDHLTEYFIRDGIKVGLIRHINSSGCVSYIIQDRKGDRIEGKFFNASGDLVKSYPQDQADPKLLKQVGQSRIES